MNSLMGKNQAMSNAKTKSGVYGCFSLHPSPTPRLCVNNPFAGGGGETPAYSFFGRLPYYYFLLLGDEEGLDFIDWKTAVLLLPFICRMAISHLHGLEDCRITTSFYFCTVHIGTPSIGRLPYLYFLLLPEAKPKCHGDWKTAVFILPFTIYF